MEQGEQVHEEPPFPYGEISCRPYRTSAMMSLTIALVSAALHIDNQGITDGGTDLVSAGFLVPWLFVLLMLNHFRYQYRIFEYLSIGGPDQTIMRSVYHGDRDSENSDLSWALGDNYRFWDGPGQGLGPKRDDRMLAKYERKFKDRVTFLPPFIWPKYSYSIESFENWTRSDFPMPSTYGKELTEEELEAKTEEVLGEVFRKKAEMGEPKYEIWGRAMERWHEPIYLLGTSPADVIELLGYKEVEDNLVDDFTREVRGWVKVWVPENPNLVEARLEEMRIHFEHWYEEGYDEKGNLKLRPIASSTFTFSESGGSH